VILYPRTVVRPSETLNETPLCDSEIDIETSNLEALEGGPVANIVCALPDGHLGTHKRNLDGEQFAAIIEWRDRE